ncbi:MAG: hypothetical protein ACLUDU_00240 [Butyricimonas faecihominis]
MQNIRRDGEPLESVGDERRTNIPALLSDSDYAATMTPGGGMKPLISEKIFGRCIIIPIFGW